MTTQAVDISTAERASAEALVREQFRIIETGELALAERNCTSDFINHRAGHEPLDARRQGPEALKATAIWLRRRFPKRTSTFIGSSSRATWRRPG